MSGHAVGSIFLGLTGLLLLAALGCRTSPLAQQKIQLREQKLQATAGLWARKEAERPDKLARSTEFIPRSLKRDAVKLERSSRDLHQWQQRDIRRWQSRQPRYLHELKRILRGKPERIKRPAAVLFL